jgi:hypothetical protein
MVPIDCGPERRRDRALKPAPEQRRTKDNGFRRYHEPPPLCFFVAYANNAPPDFQRKVLEHFSKSQLHAEQCGTDARLLIEMTNAAAAGFLIVRCAPLARNNQSACLTPQVRNRRDFVNDSHGCAKRR